MKGAIATIGMFDGMHLGHVSVISQLQSLARRLDLHPVVVTFSNHPLRVVNPSLAPRLLMNTQERKAMLGQYGDVVMLDFDEPLRRLTAAEFMGKLRDQYGVTTLLMGYNHRFGSDRLASIDQYIQAAKEAGVEIVMGKEKRIDGIEKVSSTQIRRLISQGDVATAAKALGRYYSIAGTVVHGKELGRTIGFPTANVEPLSPDRLIPLDGVYACYVILSDDSRHAAMVNVGTRPTVDDDNHATIEAHLLDYDKDLYGNRVKIEFVDRLRNEQKFASLAELRTQLQKDRDHCLTALNKK